MRTFSFASSSGTATYTAIVADDGKLLCNCKGWTMRRGDKPRHCKHTKEIADGNPLDERGEFVYLVGRGPGDLIAGKRSTPKAAKVAQASTAIAPMLASAQTSPVEGEAFDRLYSSGWSMEEKLDGHRCTITITDGVPVARSRPRQGAPAANVRELPSHIVEAFRMFPDGVYDGELVAPSGKAWDVVVVGARLVFVMFDILQSQGTDLTAVPYASRRRLMLDILQASVAPKQSAISTVESVAPSWAGVQAIWQRGGEGVILKRTGSTYQPGKRSADWLKVKQIHAATLTVIGFEAGKSGPCSAFKLRDASGVETTVKVLGNAMLREVSAKPGAFVGRRVVISYQEKTTSGTYRHGIFDHFAGEGE